jgi:hypothetical protein
MNTLTVYKTDGDYRLVRTRAKSKLQLQYTYLQHKCPKPRGHIDADNWGGLVYIVEARGWACSWCQSRASDGLQAMFWFLKEE